MRLELISFKICPFVQRSVITLHHKQTPFEIRFIDISDPPQWFQDISPFGQVPLLRVDHRHTLFESAVINEFLDEITPDSLLPSDPVKRALDRSWIEFGSACLLKLSGMIHAKEQKSFLVNRQALQKQFAWLETILGDGPYFNGPVLSLVDFAYAPLFMRTQMLNLDTDLHDPKNTPKTSRWGKNLLQLACVQDSVVNDFRSLLAKRIAKAPYAAKKLLPALQT